MKICLYILTLVLGHLSPLNAQVTRAELKEVIQAFEVTFRTDLKLKGQDLVVNEPLPNVKFDWYDSPIQNASYVQDVRNGIIFHSLTIMGGILKLEGVTQDTVVLVLCHEFGHGVGGPPFKSESDLTSYVTSQEAQADYYSTFVCAPEVWKNLRPTKLVHTTLDFGRCSDNSCRRSFEAMKGFVAYQIALVGDFELLRFDRSDSTQVKELMNDYDFYPNPQCRLDTLISGALKAPRPLCWFPQ